MYAKGADAGEMNGGSSGVALPAAFISENEIHPKVDSVRIEMLRASVVPRWSGGPLLWRARLTRGMMVPARAAPKTCEKCASYLSAYRCQEIHTRLRQERKP